MKTEPWVQMAAGCWEDYLASGYASLRLMPEEVEHK